MDYSAFILFLVHFWFKSRHVFPILFNISESHPDTSDREKKARLLEKNVSFVKAVVRVVMEKS